jgi:hypothetical protein
MEKIKKLINCMQLAGCTAEELSKNMDKKAELEVQGTAEKAELEAQATATDKKERECGAQRCVPF